MQGRAKGEREQLEAVLAEYIRRCMRGGEGSIKLAMCFRPFGFLQMHLGSGIQINIIVCAGLQRRYVCVLCGGGNVCVFCGMICGGGNVCMVCGMICNVCALFWAMWVFFRVVFTRAICVFFSMQGAMCVCFERLY